MKEKMNCLQPTLPCEARHDSRINCDCRWCCLNREYLRANNNG